MSQGIIEVIANDNFIVVNKGLANKIGLNESILLGELAGEYNYYRKENRLEYGWFYSTIENIQNNTSLTARQQRPAIEHLIELGLIEQENRGMPPKRYFKLNNKEIANFIISLDE